MSIEWAGGGSWAKSAHVQGPQPGIAIPSCTNTHHTTPNFTKLYHAAPYQTVLPYTMSCQTVPSITHETKPFHDKPYRTKSNCTKLYHDHQI